MKKIDIFLARYENACALFYRRQCEKSYYSPLFYQLSLNEIYHAHLIDPKYPISLKNIAEHPDWSRPKQWTTNADIDGISKKYLSAKIFFNNQTASSYSIDNILAFAVVGEWLESWLYFLLYLIYKDNKYMEIAKDEQRHLLLIFGIPHWLLIIKWALRAAIALPIFAIELLYLLIVKNKYSGYENI